MAAGLVVGQINVDTRKGDIIKKKINRAGQLVLQVAADSAMDQITTALSEASLRKGETERLKEDLAVNEKATQGRKGDIEQVPHGLRSPVQLSYSH